MPVPDTSKLVKDPSVFNAIVLLLSMTGAVSPSLGFPAVLFARAGGGTNRDDSGMEHWLDKDGGTLREGVGGFAPSMFATVAITDVGDAGGASNNDARPPSVLELAVAEDKATRRPSEAEGFTLIASLRTVVLNVTAAALAATTKQRFHRSQSSSSESIDGQPRRLSASRRGHVTAMDRTAEFDSRGQCSRRSFRRAFPLSLWTLMIRLLRCGVDLSPALANRDGDRSIA
jgi:hypothetical protein